jgi:tRNA(Ile)-lysidine synthase
LAKTLDLGGFGIRERGASVQVFKKTQVWNWGFSLLIKEPGVYKLKRLTIRVSGRSVYDEGRKQDGFFAALPLVLRRNCSDDYIDQGKGKRRIGDLAQKDGTVHYADMISAEDASGIAAFIGLSRKDSSVLLTRENGRRETEGLFFFSIGGRDA